MTDPVWPSRFIGIPYAPHGRSRLGADCWGLACVVFAEMHGIILPGYAGYASVDELSEIDALIGGAACSPLWQPVPAAHVRPFDIAVFRRGRLASHLGIVVRPGLMLHMVGEDRAKIEAYTAGRWCSRLAGHFRWAGPGPRGAA